MNLYFDNAAAERVTPETMSRFAELAVKYPGNQESLGWEAVQCKMAIRQAEESLLKSLGTSSAESGVIWTCTGTDAIQAAVQTMLLAYPGGGDVLWSYLDHAAVPAALKTLPPLYRQINISVKKNGIMDTDNLTAHLSDRTVFLSVPFVQPETGVIHDPSQISRLRKEMSPNALFFADLVQGIGKVPFDWSDTKPDLAAVSGQKAGCPGGAALIVSNSILRHARRVRGEFHRIGRPLPAQCILLAEKLRERLERIEENRRKLSQLKECFFNCMAERLAGQYRITIPENIPVSPAIAHVLLSGHRRMFQGAVAVRLLSEKGVSAAPGSACGAETKEPSRILTAMSLKETEAYSALRISFSVDQTTGDVEELVRILEKTLLEY